MRQQLTLYLILLCSVSCIVSKKPTSSSKFIMFEHEGRDNFNTLIKKVHDQHWTIHYSFEKCGMVNKETQKSFTQIVTKFTQSWLQPLRKYTDRPIVNDFRYHLNAEGQGADFSITTICEWGRSNVRLLGEAKINHYWREPKLTWRWVADIMHELGHLFGLADTYLSVPDWGKPGLDTGGRDATKGSQPSSHMSGEMISFAEKGKDNFDIDKPILPHGLVPLGEDDRNGIIWLYKYIYEGLVLEDCHFLNYELEESPRGCVPKYPLIFELKHSNEGIALLVIEEDENLAVNAQDTNGMTALHYAVIHAFERVVRRLIKRKDIKPFLKSKDGLTPLQLAHKLKLDRIAQIIAAHPKSLAVKAKGKQITSWGKLKKE